MVERPDSSEEQEVSVEEYEAVVRAFAAAAVAYGVDLDEQWLSEFFECQSPRDVRWWHQELRENARDAVTLLSESKIGEDDLELDFRKARDPASIPPEILKPALQALEEYRKLVEKDGHQ